MRTKVTFILLFLNAALFLFIFHFERDWRTERAALDVRRRVLGSEAADIRTLEVVQDGTTRFRIEKRGTTWFLTQPVDWPANARAVENILNELQLLDDDTSFTVKDVLKNGLSLASYGLDHPRLVVTFTSGGPDTTGGAPIQTSLEIGDTAREGQRLYLLSPDGSRVHVVGRELADELTLPLDQLRSDTVLTIPVFEARSLTLQSGGGRIHIRRDSGRWLFDTPIQARANTDATELAINSLDALRVRAFVPADPANPPSANPQIRATIEGDDRTETLLIGQPAPAAPGARPGAPVATLAQFEEGDTLRPAVFTIDIPQKLLDTLRNARDELRERRILDFEPGSVTTITLDDPNQPELTLQRLEGPVGSAGASWQILLHGDGNAGLQTLPADRAAVEGLLRRLALLSARKFQSDAPQAADLENWGFNRPERQVTLAFAPQAAGTGGQPAAPAAPVVLQIGLPTQPNGLAYARLTTSPSVYAVDADILNGTAVLPWVWRDTLLRDLPAGARITGIRITDLASGAQAFSWSDGQAAAPSPAVSALLQALHTLRARTFMPGAFSPRGAENAAGEDRPWRYRLDADIALPSGARGVATSRSTLWLTERLAGDLQVAGSEEFNAEFAIPQPFLDALWTLLYGARDPGPIPAPAASRAAP
jgi:hypothetical protein